MEILTWSESALTLHWPATITLQACFSNHICTGKKSNIIFVSFPLTKRGVTFCLQHGKKECLHLISMCHVDQPWHLPIRASLYPRLWASWRAPHRSEECTLLSGMISLFLWILKYLCSHYRSNFFL